MNFLYPITAAMFGQMSMAYMSSLVLPVVAPAVAEDLRIDPALIGLYTALVFATAMVTVNTVGPLIDRLGGLRVGQIGLVLMGAGIGLAALGWLPAFVASAVIMAAGLSMCTPSSSHVVGQFCTPKQGPLFFSFKQTGVPIGGLIAGALLPLLVGQVGWRVAVLVAAAMSIGLALLLQPFRKVVDKDRRRAEPFSLRGIVATLHVVTADRGLRRLVIAGMTFVGLQSFYGSYFVTYLVDGLGHSLALAGSVFAVAQVSALFTRILWGIAAVYVPARIVLAILALLMAAASAITGAYASSWPTAVIMVGAALFGASAFSWQGVFFAEVARLAPRGRVGAATGGVMVFIYIAMTSYPLLYGAVLKLAESYTLGFYLLGAPAIGSCFLLLRGR